MPYRQNRRRCGNKCINHIKQTSLHRLPITATTTSMEELPEEVIVYLCAFLSTRKIVLLSACCKSLRKTITHLYPMAVDIGLYHYRFAAVTEQMCRGWPGIAEVTCFKEHTNDWGLSYLGGLQNLRFFAITDCRAVSVEAAENLITMRSRTLQALVVGGAWGFLHTTAWRCFSFCTNLKKITLLGFTLDAVFHLEELRRCEALQHLHFDDCDNVQSGYGGSISGIPNLRVIEFENCQNLDIEIVESLQSSKSITRIEISECFSIDYERPPRQVMSKSGHTIELYVDYNGMSNGDDWKSKRATDEYSGGDDDDDDAAADAASASENDGDDLDGFVADANDNIDEPVGADDDLDGFVVDDGNGYIDEPFWWSW